MDQKIKEALGTWGSTCAICGDRIEGPSVYLHHRNGRSFRWQDEARAGRKSMEPYSIAPAHEPCLMEKHYQQQYIILPAPPAAEDRWFSNHALRRLEADGLRVRAGVVGVDDGEPRQAVAEEELVGDTVHVREV